MRFGQQAEVLAWGLELCCSNRSPDVFYPLVRSAGLAASTEVALWRIRPRFVFEGLMREVLLNQVVPWSHLWWRHDGPGHVLYLEGVMIAVYHYTFIRV